MKNSLLLFAQFRLRPGLSSSLSVPAMSSYCPEKLIRDVPHFSNTPLRPPEADLNPSPPRVRSAHAINLSIFDCEFCHTPRASVSPCPLRRRRM